MSAGIINEHECMKAPRLNFLVPDKQVSCVDKKAINSKNMGTPTARLEHWLSFKGGRTKIVLCQD